MFLGFENKPIIIPGYLPVFERSGSEKQAAWEHMHYSAKKCRSEATTLVTRAEIYEDCAWKLEMAMESMKKARPETEKEELCK